MVRLGYIQEIEWRELKPPMERRVLLLNGETPVFGMLTMDAEGNELYADREYDHLGGYAEYMKVRLWAEPPQAPEKIRDI